MNQPISVQSEAYTSEPSNNIIYLSDPADVSMDDNWYDYTSKDHFWMKWRFNLIKRFFLSNKNENSKVLEIGCGSGVNMQLFQSELGITIDGCDLNEHALKQIKDVQGKRYLYNVLDRNTEILNNYNSVLLLDVIEHIENDKEFVKASLNNLVEDGTVIINVPAFQKLSSNYDKNIGHLRRYNKNQLETMLTDLGLQVEFVSYWGLLLIPVLLLRKMVLFFSNKNTTSVGFQPPHEIVNKAFLLLMKTERKLFPRPFAGTSLFVVARKVKD